LEPPQWGRDARNACFLEESHDWGAILMRAALGDINESAELLITGVVKGGRRLRFAARRCQAVAANCRWRKPPTRGEFPA
jgi:hypothetical protein